MQPLTLLEASIAARIKRHRDLNPDGLGARAWIEQSGLAQVDIAAIFEVSQKTISDLCRHLGVQRDLRNARDLDMNQMPRRIPDSIKRKRALVKRYLWEAREGDEQAVRELAKMGIKFWKGAR